MNSPVGPPIAVSYKTSRGLAVWTRIDTHGPAWTQRSSVGSDGPFSTGLVRPSAGRAESPGAQQTCTQIIGTGEVDALHADLVRGLGIGEGVIDEDT